MGGDHFQSPQNFCFQCVLRCHECVKPSSATAKGCMPSVSGLRPSFDHRHGSASWSHHLRSTLSRFSSLNKIRYLSLTFALLFLMFLSMRLVSDTFHVAFQGCLSHVGHIEHFFTKSAFTILISFPRIRHSRYFWSRVQMS